MGIPMKILKMKGTHALCEADGKRELVDMILIGEQPAGTWILNFLGGAREVLSEENARQIRRALTAVSDAMQGKKHIDHLFADLVEREPQLPEHLRDLIPVSTATTLDTEQE
jgi:hydrogenase expression/formation protein HypC